MVTVWLLQEVGFKAWCPSWSLGPTWLIRALLSTPLPQQLLSGTGRGELVSMLTSVDVTATHCTEHHNARAPKHILSIVLGNFLNVFSKMCIYCTFNKKYPNPNNWTVQKYCRSHRGFSTKLRPFQNQFKVPCCRFKVSFLSLLLEWNNLFFFFYNLVLWVTLWVITTKDLYVFVLFFSCIFWCLAAWLFVALTQWEACLWYDMKYVYDGVEN